MSRIHEALKRVEQERVADTSGGGAPAAVRTDLPRPQNSSASGSEAKMPTPPVSTAPDVEALLAHCRQLDWNPDSKARFFAKFDNPALGLEEFRTLRTRLYQLREKQPLKRLLITSGLPKEGKTFVALNLAHVIAHQPGRRVLLVDGDLRGSSLHTHLGTTLRPGLADYLREESDEGSIIQRGESNNFFFIPGGTHVSNSLELIANGRLHSLLAHVEDFFDWILIDSPPAVPVADAGILANVCDGVLMVVRSGWTPFDIARKARHSLHDKPLVGAVLNGIEPIGSDSRYYYHAYGKNNRPDSQG